ncbi:MAG: hypothetical protein QOF48_1810 [Verrucomicrobiota bacterium]|jgi:hypothetical protein
MKTFLLCSILAAFTSISVQAGDSAKPCDKACADKAKAATCETACCSKQLTKKADSTAKGASQLIAKR